MTGAQAGMLPDNFGADDRGVLPSNRRPAAHRSVTGTLAAARKSWSRGDMRECLAQLDTLGEPLATVHRSEALLLRARALYRLKQYGDVIELLEPLLDAFAVGDETSTARMLHAGAVARSGEVNRGLALLDDVALDAQRHRVHSAICAEIAYTRALACWTARDLHGAERFAQDAESAAADVISVRATQLLAFIALTRGAYHEALLRFRIVQDAYWACQHRDRDLIEMAVLEVSALELTLRSKSIPGTHPAELGRRRVADSSDTDPRRGSVARVQTLVTDAWLYALDGDALHAYALARQASELLETPAWRVWTLANRAGLALAFSESRSAADYVASALPLLDTVSWDETRGEERVALLLLAETMATTHPAREAGAVLARYTALRSTLGVGEVLRDDPRLGGLEAHAAGVVARASGDVAAAVRMLSQALEFWRRGCYLWRSALAHIELAAALASHGSTKARDAALQSYAEARQTIQEHFPRSFLAHRVGLQIEADPIARRLPRSVREVLALLLAGFDAPEIARTTHRSYHTIRNHTTAARKAFAARSVPDLLVRCSERGLLGGPSAIRREPTEP